MTLQESIDLLRWHNEWRRYDGPIGEGPAMLEPKEIGLAIDKVVSSFDNGLQVGEYPIADDCTCRIVKRKVIVTKKVPRGIQPGDYRCKDCKKQSIGKSIRTAWYDTKVCFAKPKSMYGSTQLYYGAPDNRKPCEMFEKRENNDTE